MEKKELRQRLLEKRNQISPARRAEKSLSVCEGLKALEFFQSARHILFYYPIGSEVDVLPLMRKLMEDPEKTLYLPFLEGDELRALPVTDLDLLEEGEFGIPQPAPAEETFEDRLDLVLVPGVGFTQKGDRLGMGKGYYDRYLKKVCNLPKIGVTFAGQVLDELPVEAHDQKVDRVVQDGV